MKRVEVGRFGRPHGVKGLCCLVSLMESPDDIFSFVCFDENGNSFPPIAFKHYARGIFVVSIDGVFTREKAATFSGKRLFIERDLLPEVSDGVYYYADLKGLHVYRFSQPSCIGCVQGVNDFGAGDVLFVRTQTGEEILIPFRDPFVRTVNIAEGRLQLGVAAEDFFM